MNKQTFGKGMSIFLTSFSGVKADVKTQKVWFSLLSDLTDEEFLYAIKKVCLEVEEWYPTTNFVAIIRNQITVDITDEAILAWEVVVNTMRKSGAYPSVKFDNPVIHSVVMIMASSWSDFCHIPLDKWMKKDFNTNYVVMSKKDSHPEYLKGIHEISNIANGYSGHVKMPKFITTNTGKQRITQSTDKKRIGGMVDSLVDGKKA